MECQQAQEDGGRDAGEEPEAEEEPEEEEEAEVSPPPGPRLRDDSASCWAARRFRPSAASCRFASSRAGSPVSANTLSDRNRTF